MMSQAAGSTENAARKRLARKYRTLGYDVQENPGPDRLPDFMRDVSPDIVALSASDNVVIEIKTHASLKGSNDIVGIAERVSGHADWRFELVVLEDTPERAASSGTDYRHVQEQVRVAMGNRLFDMASVYLVNALLRLARDLARRNGVLAGDKSDRNLLLDMGFAGVLPDTLLDQCLSALAARNRPAHAGTSGPSEQEVEDLLRLYGEVQSLL